MTIYENLGALCLVTAVVGIILYLFIPTVNYTGAFRLAKAYLARFWAFILYAHGSVKNIIFFLALWFDLVGFALLLDPRCLLDKENGTYSCKSDTYSMAYEISQYKSFISCNSFPSLCIFILVAEVIIIWNYLNATISFYYWSKGRCFSAYFSKPVFVHFVIVVCWAVFLYALLSMIAPFKYFMILQFALAKAAISLLKNYFSGKGFRIESSSSFSSFDLVHIGIFTLIYCISQNCIIANHLYKFATGYSLFDDQAASEVEYSDTTHSRHELENEDQEPTREEELSSSRERSVAEETQPDVIRQLKNHLAAIEGTSVNVLQQLESNRAKCQEFDEKLAGIMRQFGNNQDESKEELAKVKDLLEGDRARFKEELAGIMRQLGDNHGESKEELARFDEKLTGIMRQLGDNHGESKEELANVKSLLKGNRKKSKNELAKFGEKLDDIVRQLEVKSKEDLAEVKDSLEADRVRFKKELAGIMRQLGDNHGESKEELADVKSLLKGNRKKSKNELAKFGEKLDDIVRQLDVKSQEQLADVKKLFEASLENLEKSQAVTINQLKEDQAEYYRELVKVRSLFMDKLEALAGNNTLLTETCNALALCNDLFSRNLTNNANGRPQEQSRSPCDTSNAVSTSSREPSGNSIPIKPFSSNTKYIPMLTQSSQRESTDDPSKSMSRPHAPGSNSPDVNQAGKPASCSEPPENRNPQGTPTITAVPSHSDSSPINSERAVSKDSGSNPEPRSQIEQSHTQSETDNTGSSNVEGNLPMQHESNVNPNDSPEKEECKTDPVCAQSPAKATSDNASRNAVSELPQSKVKNPTPVDSSPHHLLPTSPAKTGFSSPRRRAGISRSHPTPAAQIASPTSTTEAPGSPSMANSSTSRSTESNKENHTDPFTESDPRGSQGTEPDTVSDPAHPGSLKRDEEGSESKGSGSASEPTDQESQPHLNPETEDTGSSDSGCKPSVQQNSSADQNKPSGMEQRQNSATDLGCVQPKAGIESNYIPPQCSGSTQHQLIDEGTKFPGEPGSSSSPETSPIGNNGPGSESHRSQDIQTHEPESLHLGSPPMDDKSSNPENSGSNPGPSNETGQPHTGSETGSTNHEGDHPTQQDSTVNLNNSPVEGECETNQPCDQSKTKSTSDKTPLFTSNGEGEFHIPTQDPTSDSPLCSKPTIPMGNLPRKRGLSTQPPLNGPDFSPSPKLQNSQLMNDEKKSSSSESLSPSSAKMSSTGPGSEPLESDANSDCSSDNDGSEVDQDYDHSTPGKKYKPTLEPIGETTEPDLRNTDLAPDPPSSHSHPSIPTNESPPKNRGAYCYSPVHQPQLRSDGAKSSIEPRGYSSDKIDQGNIINSDSGLESRSFESHTNSAPGPSHAGLSAHDMKCSSSISLDKKTQSTLQSKQPRLKHDDGNAQQSLNSNLDSPSSADNSTKKEMDPKYSQSNTETNSQLKSPIGPTIPENKMGILLPPASSGNSYSNLLDNNRTRSVPGSRKPPQRSTRHPGSLPPSPLRSSPLARTPRSAGSTHVNSGCSGADLDAAKAAAAKASSQSQLRSQQSSSNDVNLSPEDKSAALKAAQKASPSSTKMSGSSGSSVPHTPRFNTSQARAPIGRNSSRGIQKVPSIPQLDNPHNRGSPVSAPTRHTTATPGSIGSNSEHEGEHVIPLEFSNSSPVSSPERHNTANPLGQTSRSKTGNREQNDPPNTMPDPFDNCPDLGYQDTAPETIPSTGKSEEFSPSQSELRQSPSASLGTSTEPVAGDQHQPSGPESSENSTPL